MTGEFELPNMKTKENKKQIPCYFFNCFLFSFFYEKQLWAPLTVLQTITKNIFAFFLQFDSTHKRQQYTLFSFFYYIEIHHI
jgi:hypothetical protein